MFQSPQQPPLLFLWLSSARMCLPSPTCQVLCMHWPQIALQIRGLLDDCEPALDFVWYAVGKKGIPLFLLSCAHYMSTLN